MSFFKSYLYDPYIGNEITSYIDVDIHNFLKLQELLHSFEDLSRLIHRALNLEISDIYIYFMICCIDRRMDILYTLVD
jgi:hypothetical protein